MEDPGVLDLSRPHPIDLVASVSNVDLAEDCPTDFRSCSASAAVWNLKH